MILEELQDSFLGEDVYVVGSGKTLEYYPKDFFEDTVTIGINQGWANVLPRVDFMVTKYHENARIWRENPRVGLLVVTRYQRGHGREEIEEAPRQVIADHNPNPVERFRADSWPTEPHALVASYSSITTGMHLAAYMGARRIFLVGADCGDLDGSRNVNGHDPRDTTLDRLKKFDLQNRIVSSELRARYGSSVVTLLPFSTPNMDGHRFTSHAGELNAP